MDSKDTREERERENVPFHLLIVSLRNYPVLTSSHSSIIWLAIHVSELSLARSEKSKHAWPYIACFEMLKIEMKKLADSSFSFCHQANSFWIMYPFIRRLNWICRTIAIRMTILVAIMSCDIWHMPTTPPQFSTPLEDRR